MRMRGKADLFVESVHIRLELADGTVAFSNHLHGSPPLLFIFFNPYTTLVQLPVQVAKLRLELVLLAKERVVQCFTVAQLHLNQRVLDLNLDNVNVHLPHSCKPRCNNALWEHGRVRSLHEHNVLVLKRPT